MKISEAMKEIKELQRKSDDLCKMIAGNCALLDYESPLYGANQQKTVDDWVQSISGSSFSASVSSAPTSQPTSKSLRKLWKS